MMRADISILFIIASALPCRGAQSAPVIAAITKGPDQINLTWSAVPNPGYGYVVEIQSGADGRYSSWTELQPIRPAAGFACDPGIIHGGSACTISDLGGEHVHNPPVNGVPYWVTESQYVDPQDGSQAQFIAWGLRPHTSYSFRIRSYSRNTAPEYGPYSNTATATTSDYALRYVSPGGNDRNTGTASDNAHAWRTLKHASESLVCGQALIVKGGKYPGDAIRMQQECAAERKAIVLVEPGETAMMVSAGGAEPAVRVKGSYIVIDGLTVSTSGTPDGDYDVVIDGSHDALLNVEVHPEAIPCFKWGVIIHGHDNLVYRSYLHDYGSPDANQNPDGNGGFVLTVLGDGATSNVIWSNHLTRGGHDESLCKAGCSNNRWLNNVMDGGWGQGWVAVAPDAENNLVEGNVIKDVGQLVTFYKPSIQISYANNTARRNVVINSRTWALEVSSFGSGSASNNLIYNNVFYNPGSCYFQSSSRGVRAYYHDIFVNNICYRPQKTAIEIYLGNPTNRLAFNVILAIGENGKPQPGKATIIWNQLAGGAFEEPQTPAYADRNYSPFARNLTAAPQFVDEARFDFHLNPGSPLAAAGIGVADTRWGSTAGQADLGAYGIVTERLPAGGGDGALESAAARARDEDYESALAFLRSRANSPERTILSAALQRAASGAEPLSPSEPADWQQVLDRADLFIRWGLFRDALNLLSRRQESDAMTFYYHGYCRDRLGYDYYASEDFAEASSKPAPELSRSRPGARLAIETALERNPLDATAHYLMGLILLDAGRPAAARGQWKDALKLRPGFPEAAAMLAKIAAVAE